MLPTIRTTARSALLAALVWAARSGGLSAEPVRPDQDDAVRMLADVMLIDGECPAFLVDFGRALQIAEATGLPAAKVMPAGLLRPAFEAATLERRATTRHDELCGDIAPIYAAHIPGLLQPR
jgi:hypothetical protein